MAVYSLFIHTHTHTHTHTHKTSLSLRLEVLYNIFGESGITVRVGRLIKLCLSEVYSTSPDRQAFVCYLS